MSVSLTPLNLLDQEDPERVQISNGEWLALTYFANKFGETVTPWPYTHDQHRYSPDELRSIATRLEQVKNAPEWLRWLADNGGAELS